MGDQNCIETEIQIEWYLTKYLFVFWREIYKRICMREFFMTRIQTHDIGIESQGTMLD